jgi:hypothetical protein
MVGSHTGAALPGNEIIERSDAKFTTKKAEIGYFPQRNARRSRSARKI